MSSEMDGASKGLLGAFVALFLGSGIASLVYGVLMLLRFIAVPYNIGIFSVYATSITLVVVGGVLILAVLFGVFGALKDNATLRMVTMVLAFLALVTLVVVGVWGMVIYKRGNLQRSIEQDMKSIHDDQNNDAVKLKFDYVFKNYNCCSAYSTHSQSNNFEGLPDTCCIVPGCNRNSAANQSQHYKLGCAEVYYQSKSATVFQMAIVALAAGGAVLIGLILYGVILQRARAGYAAVSRGV